MADFYINVFVDEERTKKLQELGLAENIKDIDGKKGFQVGMTAKDQKKLVKGFPGLAFDGSNACVLPADGDKTLFDIVCNMKSVDVMKFAITKLYNPLKGKDVFGRGTGGSR
ncbi:MAG: hypothetical protein AB7S75_03740 [Desulfococcaceae bacterium]